MRIFLTSLFSFMLAGCTPDSANPSPIAQDQRQVLEQAKAIEQTMQQSAAARQQVDEQSQ